MARIVRKFLLLLGVAATFSFATGRPDVTSKHYKVFSNEKDKYPTTNLVPSNLKVDDATFKKLMEQLDKQLSDDFNLNPMAGYFPKDVENDESDELEFINNYDESLGDDHIDAIFSVPDSGVSIAAQFGRREFSFSKVLSVSKNGTKVFSKVRQSVKVDGKATGDLSGNLNTTLDDNTSASASFTANVSISSRGKDTRTIVSGDSTIKAKSKSRLEKHRSLSDANIQTSTKLRISSLDEDVTIRTTGRTDSETFRLPFRTFFTLFGSSVNVSTDYGVSSSGKVGGEVTSHVAFASKNSSLTKSCVKAFIRISSVSPASLGKDDDDDDDDEEQDISQDDDDDDKPEQETSVGQVVLVKAKTHTWTKVVSASKSGLVLDIITCTKARAYSKGWQKGKSVVFAGTGQVQWEKSQIKITGEDLAQLSAHEYGLHYINKQLESGSLIGFGATGVN